MNEFDYYREIVFGLPQKLDKGWGYELIISNNKYYCGKILHYYKKGAVSSFHLHPEKKESFLCLRGCFSFKYKDEKGRTCNRRLLPGETVHIPNCRPHQLESLDDESEVFEVSTYHSDYDVVRIEPGDSQK